jgi:hypothetical protein
MALISESYFLYVDRDWHLDGTLGKIAIWLDIAETVTHTPSHSIPQSEPKRKASGTSRTPSPSQSSDVRASLSSFVLPRLTAELTIDPSLL